MNKKSSREDHTVIMSDEYFRESGIQGGKVISEHLALGSLLIGIPLLLIGLITLIGMIFDIGVPRVTTVAIGSLLVTVIGLLLVIGGFSIYKSKEPVRELIPKI